MTRGAHCWLGHCLVLNTSKPSKRRYYVPTTGPETTIFYLSRRTGRETYGYINWHIDELIYIYIHIDMLIHFFLYTSIWTHLHIPQHSSLNLGFRPPEVSRLRVSQVVAQKSAKVPVDWIILDFSQPRGWSARKMLWKTIAMAEETGCELENGDQTTGIVTDGSYGCYIQDDCSLANWKMDPWNTWITH